MRLSKSIIIIIIIIISKTGKEQCQTAALVVIVRDSMDATARKVFSLVLSNQHRSQYVGNVANWFKHILFRRKGLGAACNRTMSSQDVGNFLCHDDSNPG